MGSGEQEGTVIIKVGNQGLQAQGGSHRYREMWSDSRYHLEAKPRECSDGLDDWSEISEINLWPEQ